MTKTPDEDGKFSGLDHLAPGAGAAARMGEELAKRTIRYACQNAGVGVKGLLEAFPAGDNPKASIGTSWFDRIIKAIRP